MAIYMIWEEVQLNVFLFYQIYFLVGIYKTHVYSIDFAILLMVDTGTPDTSSSIFTHMFSFRCLKMNAHATAGVLELPILS